MGQCHPDPLTTPASGSTDAGVAGIWKLAALQNWTKVGSVAPRWDEQQVVHSYGGNNTECVCPLSRDTSTNVQKTFIQESEWKLLQPLFKCPLFKLKCAIVHDESRFYNITFRVLFYFTADGVQRWVQTESFEKLQYNRVTLSAEQISLLKFDSLFCSPNARLFFLLCAVDTVNTI